MSNLDRSISDFSASLLLRYFRSGLQVGANSPRVESSRDVQLIKMHWALSRPVRSLIDHVKRHPHEIESFINLCEIEAQGIVRGRIDARATVLAQNLRSDPALIVSHEPSRSFITGGNLLVLWVLREAHKRAAGFERLQPKKDDAKYFASIRKLRREINAVTSSRPFGTMMHLINGVSTPSTRIRREARRARRTLFSLADDAYEIFQGVAKGDHTAIGSVLNDTLTGPLETWRTFELAVGLSIAEAISAETGILMLIDHITPGFQGPILRCGKYSIYWQSKTRYYREPDLEPTEKRLKVALSAYGIDLADDRPDLVIVDEEQQSVISVVEVKYSDKGDASDRLREAFDQIVGYTRAYRACAASLDELTKSSLVALSAGAPVPQTCGLPAPAVVDFAAIQRGEIRQWVQKNLLHD